MTDDAVPRPALDRVLLASAAPWRVEVVDAAPSTNAAVLLRARAGEEPGLVLVAEHQTAGRGRLDRQWVTPPRAALTFSALVGPGVPPERWPWLPLLTGLAVAEGVQAAGGPVCGLKWPNDVQYDGRKVAGLLAEMVEGPSGPRAVLGVGINVSTAAEELPLATATSLAIEGFAVDRSALLVAVLERLSARLESWTAVGGDPTAGGAGGLLSDYERRCVTLGQRVRVHLPRGALLEGEASAVGGDGALVVTASGVPHAVSAGDVVHVRPGTG